MPANGSRAVNMLGSKPDTIEHKGLCIYKTRMLSEFRSRNSKLEP
jgi:hypothetical protein